MILTQADNGWWTDGPDGWRLVNTHDPEKCAGRLCDVHDRRGPEPYASWPLNWRGDRGVFEVICPHGIGHPTAAQRDYWQVVARADYGFHVTHGCCGCCAGIYPNPRKEAP